MGIPVGGGFNFFTSPEQLRPEFVLTLENLDLEHKSIDFSIMCRGTRNNYSLGLKKLCPVIFPEKDVEPIRVFLRGIYSGGRGDMIANLDFYSDFRYIWEKF